MGAACRRVGSGRPTGQVDEDVAAVVREKPLGARRAGGEPASQDTQEVLHRHLGNRTKGGARGRGRAGP